MRNSKGFTLAELLGVLTLLAIIALITVPLVNKYITNSRQKAYNAEMTTLKTAAQQWLVKNSASVQWDEDGYYALNLDVLKQSEFLGDEAIYNPLNPKEEITGCIVINSKDGKYSYEYNKYCIIPKEYVFDYTGSVQSVTLPTGTYKLEVWGGQGGSCNTTYYGGYGGYSIGTYTLTSSTTLYILVGGAGSNAISSTLVTGGYNGGGNCMYSSSYCGGGATPIALSTGVLSSLSANTSAVLIVAGGGGGAYTSHVGASAGGYRGNTSSGSYPCSGGTQTAGGTCTSYSNSGAFGLGGLGGVSSDNGGAGGGGWYGGGGSTNDVAGGGGSGYIGGVNSSYEVTKAMYCYNCTTSSATSTLTYSITNFSATATTNYAKLGNGYAKITRIG